MTASLSIIEKLPLMSKDMTKEDKITNAFGDIYMKSVSHIPQVNV